MLLVFSQGFTMLLPQTLYFCPYLFCLLLNGAFWHAYLCPIPIPWQSNTECPSPSCILQILQQLCICFLFLKNGELGTQASYFLRKQPTSNDSWQDRNLLVAPLAIAYFLQVSISFIKVFPVLCTLHSRYPIGNCDKEELTARLFADLMLSNCCRLSPTNLCKDISPHKQ